MVAPRHGDFSPKAIDCVSESSSIFNQVPVVTNQVPVTSSPIPKWVVLKWWVDSKDLVIIILVVGILSGL